jgi:hypothetical protein
MGRVNTGRRHFEIKRKRQHRLESDKLRVKYRQVKTKSEQELVIGKALHQNANLTRAQFLQES